MSREPTRVGVGLMLAPEGAWLDRLEGAIREDVDYYAVTPETLWRVDASGAIVPNGYHARFAALRAATGRPFVAHSVGMSPGGVAAGEDARRGRWLARMAEDARIFGFEWWTDHLGVAAPGGRFTALPLPVPYDRAAAEVVTGTLARMQEVVSDVGLENTATCFTLGDPRHEPAFIEACLEAPRTHLLLDLHNLHTMATNLGFDPREWLARVDLSRVIEIHVSGGSDSDPAWLASRASHRLDSHDDAVPEAVWQLLEGVLPGCERLRGVTLERMEGTVDAPDVSIVRAELARIRALVDSCERTSETARDRRDVRLPAGSREDLLAVERVVGDLVCAEDPTARLDAIRAERAAQPAVAAALAHIPPDQLSLAAILVARLRFERLLQGSPDAAARYDEDAAAFAARFRRYHAAVPPTAIFPPEEARAWDAFTG